MFLVANVIIKMKVSKKIKQKILKDNQFSLRMAIALDKTQEAVKQSARRNSSKLSEASYIAFFKSEGFTEDEIFERVAPAGNKK